MRGRWPLLVLGIGLLAVAAGCTPEDPQSTFDAVGPIAESQRSLFYIIFAVAAIVFVGVEGLLLFTILRFRRRSGQGIPVQTHGNTTLEIAWSIAPALVLVVVVVPTIQTIFTNASPPADREVLEVTVTGHQWWWEFEYPSLGVTTANELHIPAGKVVNLTLLSNDVIHAFWVPKLGGKRDAIPTRANTLWLQGDKPGDYYGQCAELCGVSHANMRLKAVVEEQGAFDAWVAGQRAVPPAPTDPAAVAGQQLFLDPTLCRACHTIAGTTATAKVGPDLTHIGSRRYIAAGLLTNTPESMNRWLTDPNAVKPGVKMVLSRTLTSQERASLTAYLRSLQ
jgi:cytochrome c oxidase subunit 2